MTFHDPEDRPPIQGLFRSVLALGAMALSAGAEPLVAFKGLAYEPGTSTLIYSEHYSEQRRGDLTVIRTEYRIPGGDVVAVRTLDFSRHAFKPDYRIVDSRDGYEEGARVLETKDAAENGARVHVYARAKRGKPLREKTLRVPEPCVIDGGFNAFIKDHWEDLSAGRRAAFNFVVPSERDYFAFEAVPADAPETGGTPAEKGTLTFLIRPENAALRLLVAPIRVTYDVETRRMKEYRGLSNVNDDRGKSFKVRLIYPNLGP